MDLSNISRGTENPRNSRNLSSETENSIFFIFFFSYVVHSFINVFVCVWIKSSQKYIIQMKYWYNNLFFYVTPYPYTPYTHVH